MTEPVRLLNYNPTPVPPFISPKIYDPGFTYAGTIPVWNAENPACKEALLMMAAFSTGKRIKILLADDDEDDRDLFKEAVEEVKNNAEVQTVKDGDALMYALNNGAPSLPDLIFLDINMPCKNGQECLREIRHNEKLKEIPVIIYSTSARPDLVDDTFNWGANLYVQKPDSYKGIKEIAKKILSLKMSELKSKPAKENYFISYTDNL